MEYLRAFNGDITLFGGEPTLYRDRLKDVCFSDPYISSKIKSITTNLMIMDDEMLSILESIGYVGTSWSPSRFTDKEYDIWKSNIDLINGKIKVRVLSTMTNELLSLSPDVLMGIISKWNTNTIKDIDFEYYVGPESTPEYFEKCDQWLCEIYKKWDSPVKIVNADRVASGRWCFNCNDVYSLYPDGTVKNGCPHNLEPRVPDECYSCDRSDKCRPCMLQSYCSYPKKFAELIRNSI